MLKPPKIMTNIATVRPSVVVSLESMERLALDLHTIAQVGLERCFVRQGIAVNALNFQALVPAE